MVESLISDVFPYLPLTITIRGIIIQTQALIDTGFDGAVILPVSFAIEIPGPPSGGQVWRQSDGSDVWTQVYEGDIQIEVGVRPPHRLVSLLGDEPIVGRRVLDNFRITLDHGRRVIVEP